MIVTNPVHTPVPLSDRAVSDIPVSDNGEQLISIEGLHPLILIDRGNATVSKNGALAFWFRSGACAKLIDAAKALPNGYAFLVKETFRPLSVQIAYFERSLVKIRNRHPEGTPDQIIEAASRFTAPPQVAGHPTGGAIDLTLANRDGLELDMGCQYDEDEAASDKRCFSDAKNISELAKRHRNVMFEALSNSGFVNYPFEWWHWSYGDKYWAFASDVDCSIYGAIED